MMSYVQSKADLAEKLLESLASYNVSIGFQT